MLLRDRYYLRLDDAHERMNWKNWKKIEDLCIKYRIKPLIAVIPNNNDLSICYNSKPNNMCFESTVQRWQKAGWHIGLHGYDHVLATVDPAQSILPLNNISEFVHLPRPLVENKILLAYANFESRNVKSKIFVPPAHSYNVVTLEVLKKHTAIRVVSDGWDYLPFNQDGITFLPQQLWKFRRMFFGHWTICLHPCSMCDHDFETLEEALKRHCNKFGSFDDFIGISEKHDQRKNSLLFKWIWRVMLQLKRRR